MEKTTPNRLAKGEGQQEQIIDDVCELHGRIIKPNKVMKTLLDWIGGS